MHSPEKKLLLLLIPLLFTGCFFVNTLDDISLKSTEVDVYSDTKVSLEMNISISKVNKLSRIVRDKMNRVDSIHDLKKISK